MSEGRDPAERDTDGAGAEPQGPNDRTDSPTPPRPSGHAAPASGFFCDLCGAEMLGVHCKLVCPQCGYKRDCSDP